MKRIISSDFHKLAIIGLLLQLTHLITFGQTDYSAIYVEKTFILDLSCQGNTVNTNYWTSAETNTNFDVWRNGNFCDLRLTFNAKQAGSESDNLVCYGGPPSCPGTETIEATVTYYEFPKLTTNNLTPYMCVANVNDPAFDIITNFGYPLFSGGHVKNYFVQVSNKSDFSNTHSVQLSMSSTSNNVSYRDIAGDSTDAWYGQDLYFRIELEMTSGGTIYGPAFNTTMFVRAVITPTLVSVDRSACQSESITLNVDPSLVDVFAQNYRIRARVSNEPEDFLNIIKFDYHSHSNNNFVYKIEDINGKLLSTRATYTFQAFDVSLNEFNIIGNITCVKNWNDDIIAKPKQASQTSTPQVVKTVGMETFHLTRHDVTDGKINITVSNHALTDQPLTVEYQRNDEPVQTIAFDLLPGSTNTKVLGGLNDSTYKVRVVDADGCPSNTVEQTHVLNKPKPVTFNEFDNYKLVTCHENNQDTDPGQANKNDGAMGVSWEGGIPPYTLEYGDTTIPNINATSQNLPDLAAGNYNFTITDMYGVTITGNDTVHSNLEITLDMSNTEVLCYGDNTDISVTLQNNTENENTYLLYNLQGALLDNSGPAIPDNTHSFTNHPAVNYRIDVTSGYCIATDTIEVVAPDSIALLTTPSKIAEYGGNTGTIDIDLSGGTGAFTYSVYKSPGTQVDTGNTVNLAITSGLTHGYYDVYTWDANRCFTEHTNLFVQQPDAPLELTFNQLNVDCFGNTTGEVYPKATGGWTPYQYGFNGVIITSDTIIPGLGASTVTDTVFVVDSAGITYKLPVTITEPEVLASSLSRIHNLKCYQDNTGAVKLDITGGTSPYRVSTDSINWTPGDSIGNLAANNSLDLYVLDAHNCESAQQVTITEPQPLSIATDTIVDAFCLQSNGSINVNISGGTVNGDYQYQWHYLDSSQVFNTPGSILENIYSGQYRLVASDDNNCTNDNLYIVADVNGPVIESFTTDSVSCFGKSDGSITLTQVSGGMPAYNYFINSTAGTSTITGLPQGIHHVRVLDAKGCKLDQYIEIFEPNVLEIYDAVVTPPICHESFDGSVVVAAAGGNGGYIYNWSTGLSSPILDGLNSGTFTLTITDRKNCTLIEAFEILPPAMPQTSWEKKEALICTGNYIELDGGDFTTWSWRNEAQEVISTERFVNLSESGSYILQLTDGNGCTGLDTFHLKVSDTPLESKILLPDSARVDETIGVIDVTWPVPDSVHWIYDQPVTVLDSNNWSQRFTASQEGIVNVTLRAWYDGCYSDSSKSVAIYFEDGFVEEELKMAGALITGFRAYPNPNDGIFRVGVKLSQHADITLSLYKANSAQLLDRKEYNGMNRYEVPYMLTGLKPGIYVIVLQSGTEQQTMKIIIGR